ncbi:MAG: hypothetical protein WBW88_15380 [Rhodothermales bacterium]
MRERLVCAALLVCVGFVLSGCGEGDAPAPADAATTGNTAVESAPSDSDISVVVRDHVQDRLVTSSLHSSDLARAGMGMPPNFGPPGGMPPGPFGSPPGFGPGGPPPGNDPAARYEAQLTQGSRQFSLTTKKPQIAKERDEQIIKARVVDVRITHRKARTETHHEISFEVEQELLTDLYKLATSSELRKAIQWDTKRVSSATTAAKKIAEPKRSKLDQQWKQLLASRAWVLEKEHATGSRWTATGKIQSRLVDSKWVHEVTQLRPKSSISRQIVSPEYAPPGLLVVDPGNYQASANEWSRPYTEFFAAVEKMTAESDALAGRQKARLVELMAPGKTYVTTIRGAALSATVKLQVEEVRENGIWNGHLVVTRTDNQGVNDVSIFGFLSRLNEHDLPELKSKVPAELLGHVMRAEPDDAGERQRHTFHLAARPEDEAPTLIWLQGVWPMTRATE